VIKNPNRYGPALRDNARPRARVVGVLNDDRDVVFLKVLDVRLRVDLRLVIRELLPHARVGVRQPPARKLGGARSRAWLADARWVERRNHGGAGQSYPRHRKCRVALASVGERRGAFVVESIRLGEAVQAAGPNTL